MSNFVYRGISWLYLFGHSPRDNFRFPDYGVIAHQMTQSVQHEPHYVQSQPVLWCSCWRLGYARERFDSAPYPVDLAIAMSILPRPTKRGSNSKGQEIITAATKASVWSTFSVSGIFLCTWAHSKERWRWRTQAQAHLNANSSFMIYLPWRLIFSLWTSIV